MSNLMNLMDKWLGLPQGDETTIADWKLPESIRGRPKNITKTIRTGKTKPIEPTFWDEFEPADPPPVRVVIPVINYYQMIKRERERKDPWIYRLEGIDWKKVMRNKAPQEYANQLTGPRHSHKKRQVLTAY